MKNSCDCHTLCHFILTKTVTLVVLLIRLTGDSDCGLKLDTFDSCAFALKYESNQRNEIRDDLDTQTKRQYKY